MHEPVLHQEQQLLLGEAGIDQRIGHRLEGQVPGGVPGILPLVWHGDDVEIEQVPPVAVTDAFALCRWHGLGRIAIEPAIDLEIVELLGPQQACQGLALHQACIGVADLFLQGGVEGIGFGDAFGEDRIGIHRKGIRGGQPQVDHRRGATVQLHGEMGGRLAAEVATDRLTGALHHVVVDAVLEGTLGGFAGKTRQVGFVVAEQPLDVARSPGGDHQVGAIEIAGADLLAFQAEHGARRGAGPGPGIARPDLWQYPQAGALGAAVLHRDPHEDVVGGVLGVFDGDIEITILGEDAGVENLVFPIIQAAPGVFLGELGIGEGGVGVLVEHLLVGMARYAIQVEIELLDVFAMVALGVGQAEQAFLEKGIAFVPQGDAQAPLLGLVAEPGEAILAPAIGTAARMVMGKVAPGVAIGAVVLTDRGPLALAQVGTPLAPGGGIGIGQALAFAGMQDARGGMCRHRVS